MNAELFFDNNSTIVVAACNNPADSSALMRWVLPVLEEWPQQAWRAWLSDQSQPGKVRASLVTGSDKQSGWRDIDVSDFAANGGMCRMLGRGSGLVILTHGTIAKHVLRALDGLTSRLACIAANDPAAKPFKRSFASFGA